MNIPAWISWQSVGNLLNSEFTTSLMGTLAGAFAGAWAAQSIAERSKQRDQLLAQIRTTNAAISASFVFCNLLIALKRQHIKPLYETFLTDKAALAHFNEQRRMGKIQSDQPFEFTADLRTLQVPLLPVDLIERLVIEKLSVIGRPLALATSLSGIASALSDSMRRRSAQIDVFKQIPPDKQELLAALYFGHSFAPDRRSTEYADTLAALFNQTDDGIFFSQLLCRDLMESGKKVLEEYKRVAKKSIEHISIVDFQHASQLGLMPDESKYQDWLQGFQRSSDNQLAARNRGV